MAHKRYERPLAMANTGEVEEKCLNYLNSNPVIYWFGDDELAI